MTVLLCIAVFLAGFGLAWLVLSGRRGVLLEQLRGAGVEAARLAGELAEDRRLRSEAEAAAARLAAELAGERAGAEARLAELRSAHERLRAEFAEAAAAALRANRDDFLRLAEQSFTNLHDKSAGDLASRQQAIDALVKPLKESLDKVDLKIGELEKVRSTAYGALGQQLETLGRMQAEMQKETTKLSSALSSTRGAGTWGELQLRRVVELADMTAHCDFEEQVVMAGDRSRPDMVVNFPGGQRIVVDAKAPIEAYREAANEPDPLLRQAKLREHAAKVRGHIDALSSREYWAQIEPSPEFVVLFLPGDSLFAAAVEADPHLIERAIKGRVLLATPMTLIALLKSAAYGWRQEDISQNAEEVSRLGRDLYDRIATFRGHLGNTGKGLAAAVKHFNSAVGSFEQNLLPGARRFEELGAKGNREVGLLEPVDEEPREVTKGS